MRKIKKWGAGVLAISMMLGMAFGISGCGKKEEGNSGKNDAKTDAVQETTELQVFIAASLNKAMTELAEKYQQTHPEIKILYNADSSGTLMNQIKEGYECDLFFSAAQKQMNLLEEEGLVVEGTRQDVVNNQVVVITLKGSGTAVTGLDDLEKAKSIALAGGSVPVGKYTRQALVNMGKLPSVEDVSKITTEQVSEALGGVEISEQDNVSKVLAAVAEGSCEVGTTYYSDTWGYEDKLEVLETVSKELTGSVTYPIARIINKDAKEKRNEAAEEFLSYVLSDEAKEVFRSYYFDTDL